MVERMPDPPESMDLEGSRPPVSTGRQIAENAGGAGLVTLLLFAFLPEGLLSNVQVGALAAFAAAAFPVGLTILRNVSHVKGWDETWLKGVLGVLLLLLVGGCAFSNVNPFSGTTKWTIADGQVDCVVQDGYPSGPDCVASGSEAVAAIAEAKAEIESFADEPEAEAEPE